MPNSPSFIPNLNSRTTYKFETRKVFWWMMFTRCPQFCSKLSMRRQGWHFDWEVLTDGVSVSIVLAQFPSPAPYATITAAPAHQLPRQPPPLVPSVTGPVGPTHPVVQTAGRTVGLDPGRNHLFVAVVHSQRAHNMIGMSQPTPADKYETFGWSRSKWYDSSGIDCRNARCTEWLSQTPLVESLLQTMPSAKVASTAMFGVHVHYRLQHLAPVLHLYTARRFRKLRWSRHIKKQRAMSAMCNDITACNSSTVVAFGDASFRHFGRGNAATPTKALRTALGQRCHVFDVDEFRTSALCCACKHRMRGMPLPTALGETAALHHSEFSRTYPVVSTCACTICRLIHSCEIMTFS